MCAPLAQLQAIETDRANAERAAAYARRSAATRREQPQRVETDPAALAVIMEIRTQW
jgi:hypothetical protein